MRRKTMLSDLLVLALLYERLEMWEEMLIRLVAYEYLKEIKNV